MIKAGYLLTALLVFFTVSHVSAQSHVTEAGSMCRYAKNSLRSKNISWEGHRMCPACDKEDAKEKIAKNAEDKRREDARAVALAAENLAKKKALEAELKRKREAEKGVTEVAVTISGNKDTQSSSSSNTTVAENEMVKNYFYTRGEFNNQSLSDMIFKINVTDVFQKWYAANNYFIVNNKKILDNDEFRVCIGVRPINIFGNNPTNFPPGIGIVILNESAEKHVISDLIDATGKRLLNDDKISAILHFVDDYFILLEGEHYGAGSHPYSSYHFPNGVIYNHKTKQREPLRKFVLSNGRSYVKISWVVNGSYLSKKKLRDKSTYKAFMEVETDYGASTVYYITNDGKLESDDIIN